MPYTPPTHRSPACSAPASPDTTRRSSFTASGPGAGSPRPTLPRSASYAAKHRRTPSAVSFPSLPITSVTNGSSPEITPPGTSDDLKGMLAAHTGPVRQSPPPVVTGSRAMPPGAIISPPESSSEDEGVSEPANRARQIENLKELKEAISTLPQHRSPSPDRTSSQPGDLLVLPSQVNELTSSPTETKPAPPTKLPPISLNGARKASHTRSATEPRIFVSKSADTSVAVSDDSEEQDDEPLTKPVMVRKKSGELVRPALRPASYRRPSSMPGTPTFSKAVHFDSHLEHVRHFLQVDRPLAVSASSSPNENYESDTEYPFGTSYSDGANASSGLDIVLPNFPADSPIRKALPARVERVWLSSDQKSLMGVVVVANLAFQKSVLCRFTYDYWKTTSEVAAEYSHAGISSPQEAGYDRFQFTLKLSDLANFESKTLFFCVRYTVNGTDYWDNNDGVNFQVDFTKKAPRVGKRSVQRDPAKSMGALPRSNRRTHPIPRPRSMPVGALDDFGHDAKLADLDQPLHEVLGESRPSSLRLKSSKSSLALPTDNLANKVSTPSGQAFANRYDFGASLSAAKEAQRRPEKEALYMKPNNKKATFGLAPAAEVPRKAAPIAEKAAPSPQPALKPAVAASPVPGTDSPSAVNIRSSSYEEILNKYCFFNGSKQSSPQMKDGTLGTGRYDGSDDPFTPITNSNDSSLAGSPNMTDRSHRGALHYSIHQSLRQNLNPYFQNGQMSAIGASPVESPLQHPSSMSANSGLSKSSSTSPTPMTGFAPFATIKG